MFRIGQSCLKLAGGFCRHRSSSTLVRNTRVGMYPGRFPPNFSVPHSTVRLLMSAERRRKVRSFAMYCTSFSLVFAGLSFLAVPLYRAFCQKTGLGGVVQRGHNVEKLSTMEPVENRPLVIQFRADRDAAMKWNFRPMQSEIKLVPGETALAFYRARNPTDKPIIGVSTYNVLPFEAGLYFNKIQCFCFEEQRLNPGEEIDMPVFFYVDPEIMENPRLATSDHIVLSYTFFETQEEEVDKFLETLEKERNDDLEKARQMQQRRGDNVTTNVKFLLERARPGLSQHTVTKNPKAPSTEPAEKDKGK